MTFDGMWADLEPVGRDAVHRRLPPLRLDAGGRRAARVVPRRGAGRAAWRSCPTAPATSGPGPADPDADGPGSGPRQPPRLGARRRRLRRPAGHRLGVRRAGPAARAGRRRRPAARHRLLRRRGGRPLRRRLRRLAAAHRRAGPRPRPRARPTTTAPRWPRRWPARRAGPGRLGRDEETLRRIGTFVELHVEQGRGLVDGDAAGRRRLLDLAARPLAAGPAAAGPTTPAPPGWPTATTRCWRWPPRSLARPAAAERHGTVATVGKVRVRPNGVNAIPSSVTAWLDARGAD